MESSKSNEENPHCYNESWKENVVEKDGSIILRKFWLGQWGASESDLPIGGVLCPAGTGWHGTSIPAVLSHWPVVAQEKHGLSSKGGNRPSDVAAVVVSQLCSPHRKSGQCVSIASTASMIH